MAVNELDRLEQGKAPVVTNEYEAMLDGDREAKTAALKGSMFVAQQKDPARQAQVLDLAQKASLPASVVEKNFDEVKKRTSRPSIDYSSMIDQTPGLAKWLEDPNNATLGRDDLDALGRINKHAQAMTKTRGGMAGDLVRAGETGFRGIESSAWHLAAAYGLSTPEEAAEQAAAANKRSQELRSMIPDYAKDFNDVMEREGGDVNKAFERFTGSFETLREGKIMQALKDFTMGQIQTVGEVTDMIGAAAVRPRGLLYSTTENLANSLPSLAAGAAMAKGGAAVGALTGPAAPVAVPALAIGGMATGSFMGAVPVEVGAWINQELQSRGVDITDPQALTAAYKDSKLMADVRAEGERKGVTTAGVDALFNAFAGRFMKGAKPGLASKALAGTKEIATQTVGEITSEFSGQVAARGGIQGTNFGEAIQEGITSLGRSAVDVGVGTSARALFSKNTAKAAEEVAESTQNALKSLHEIEQMQEIGKAVKELKNTGSVPGKVRELIDSGQAPEAVFFQTDDWDSYWRSKGKSPAKAAEQMMDDGGKAYFEAKMTGQDIQIPFSQYIEKTARAEDFEGLLPSVKTSADGMTAQQSIEHMKSLPATLQELAAETIPDEEQAGPTPEQSSAAVGKEIADQLKEVGVDPTQAILYQEGFRVLGERMGMDPKELFDQYRLKITGELPAGEGATYNQPARSVMFPVKQSPEGIFSVSPGEGLNAAGRIVDGKMQIEGLYFDKKYQGVGQDMIRSLERTALGAGAYSMEAVATTEQQRSVLEAQGFELQSESGDGAVMFKDLSAARTYNQAVEMAPPMYSKLEQTIMQKMGGSQDVQSLRAMLKDIKPEEMKWSGLDELLKGKEKVTKQEVLDHIRANQVQVKEISKFERGGETEAAIVQSLPSYEQFIADDIAKNPGLSREDAEMRARAAATGMGGGASFPDSDRQLRNEFIEHHGGVERPVTKFSQYTLPGGENYREVLFTLPEKDQPDRAGNLSKALADLESKSRLNDEATRASLDARKSLREAVDKSRSLKSKGMTAKDVNSAVDWLGLAPRDQWNDERNTRYNELITQFGKSPLAVKFAEAVDLKIESQRSWNDLRDAKKIAEALSKGDTANTYRSSHFDEANVLAHVRLNDRTDADGKKVLFVEEIQSDWHQEGRKKGYKGEQAFQIKDADGEVFTDKFKTKEEAQAFIDKADITEDVRKGLEIFEGPTTTGVPDAPFKKTWHEFAMKRIIRMAAEGGYDRVAWTTGEQQAERYDLSKQLNSIEYKKNDDGTYNVQAYSKNNSRDGNPDLYKNRIPESELSDLIGKEMAEKIVAGEGKKRKGSGGEYIELTGLDLKVGGEGMKGFYDKILVDFAKKFGKKFGAGVGVATIQPSRENMGKNFFIQESADGGWEVGKQYSDEPRKLFKTRDEAVAYFEKLGTKVHSLDITEQLRDAALNEGFTLFQADGNDIRGQIRIGPGGINISILKNANFSTFIHETGHFYLEVLKDLAARDTAPQQIKDDWQAIRNWLGAKDGEELTVDMHEKFAVGFEGYLLEGKAPTSKLAEAFSRFKVWLMSVYRKLRPAVEFSPEIKDVMNRLFATDEELRIAQGDYPALFDDPAATGMNEKQAERYMQARFEAKLAAEEELTRKIMKDFRRQEQAFYKEKRKGVETEVREELINTREYAALAILQSKLPSPEVFKISSKSIQDMGLKVSELPPRITAKDGLHVEQAALALGFRDGAELVEKMKGLPKLEDAIKAETDRRMQEYYPDMLQDPKLSEETIKSIHNEKRSELLEIELAHLAMVNPSTLKDVTRRIARRPPTIKEIRKEAVRVIGTMKAKDIKPHLFQLAERKAAKEAGKALTDGDLDAAFEAKQRELLNHELYREAQKARELIDDSIRDFKKFRQSDEKLAKSRDMNLVDTARGILAAFGIGPEGSDQYVAQEILSKMQKYDPEQYQTAQALFEDATQNGVGPWKSVPFDDFVAMKQSVDALWDLAKNVKQIEVNGKKMDLEQAKEELIAQAIKFDKGDKKPYVETAGFWGGWRSKLLSSKAAMIRVEHWADAMDVGGNREFTNYIVRPVIDGATKYRLAKGKVLEQYRAILKAHEKNMSRDPIMADELVNRVGKPHRFRTKSELLMALLHTGNESNKRKLLVGWGWGSVDEMGVLDTKNWDAFIDRMHREGVLTKADYEFAQAVWDLMESLKPDAQKAHKQMHGHYFKEITAEPVITPYGAFRGGYIPAKVDVNESEDADIRSEREAFEKTNNSYQFPTTGRGFTKSRVENYAAPLVLDMNMLGGHIDAVLRFVHIEPRVKEVSRIVMDKGFREVLRRIDPEVAKEALIPWLQRAAQQQVVTPSTDGLGRLTDAMASLIRRNVAMQLMFGNVTNTLQQITGTIVAATKISPRNLARAHVNYIGDMKRISAEILEKSEWMRATQGSNTYETAQAINKIIVQPSTFENMQEFAAKHTYFLQTATQGFVNNIVWLAGYNEALESGMSDQQAIKEADSKVRMTQGTVNPEDVSRFETGTQTARLFKQFVGYFNMLANLNGFEVLKIARTTGLKKGAGRAFYVYSMGLMIPAVMSELIVRAMSGKGFDEDDDDEYLDDMLSAFVGSQFKTIAATVPYGGAVAVSAYNRFNEQRYDDRLSLSPAISIIEGTAGIPYELYQKIANDVDNDKRVTKNVLTLVGIMSSLPAGPIGKPVGYLIDVNEGRTEPSGPIDFARGLVTGKGAQK